MSAWMFHGIQQDKPPQAVLQAGAVAQWMLVPLPCWCHCYGMEMGSLGQGVHVLMGQRPGVEASNVLVRGDTHRETTLTSYSKGCICTLPSCPATPGKVLNLAMGFKWSYYSHYKRILCILSSLFRHFCFPTHRLSTLSQSPKCRKGREGKGRRWRDGAEGASKR